MIKFTIITPFPEVIETYTSTSILGRAAESGVAEFNVIDLRQFGDGPHRKIDDYPFGGGPGMILMPGPIFEAFRSVYPEPPADLKVILPSPAGRVYDQSVAAEFTEIKEAVIICGHYKGVDQRVRDSLVTDEISIGDYVLTGGEIPALIIMDSVVRLLEGAIGDPESAEQDSFSHPLLDGPHYTRPAEFEGMSVPEVLVSGNHAKIDEWRHEQRLKITTERRADLLPENQDR